MKTVRYHIEIESNEKTVGFVAAGLASIADGNVVNTVPNFNGKGTDLAVIEVSTNDIELFEAALEEDDRVTSYR
jgi:hypothetical protein